MKKGIMSFILFWLIITTHGTCFCDQIISAKKVNTPPAIDGKAGDPAWEQAKSIITHDDLADIDITLKAVYDDKIYFLVVFPDPDESRLHKTWVWNKKMETYETGPDREDTFVFKWNMTHNRTNLSIHSNSSHLADIWFWKANRTDPAGFADDKIQHFSDTYLPNAMKITSTTDEAMFLQRTGDKGSSAYQPNLAIEYIGNKIPRYSHQAPQGSRKDIVAKGVWSNGKWVIEFARKLQTGHPDDIQFYAEPGHTYQFGVSRYEIGGRKPDPTTTQPLHGAGDVSENLILEFIQ